MKLSSKIIFILSVIVCVNLPMTAPVHAEQTIAFVVGVQKYKQKKYDKLNSVARDAEDIFDRLNLISKNFDRQRSKLLLGLDEVDDISEQPYHIADQELDGSKILTEFRTFLGNVEDEDTVIIYFGGHGLNIGKDKDLVFLPGNYTDDNELYIRYDTLFNDIENKIDKKINVKVVFFANMCGSGAAQGQLGPTDHRNPDYESFQKLMEQHTIGLDQNFALIPATADDAPSFEDAEGGRSRLAHLLLKGFSGSATTADNNTITTGSLYDYIDDNIPGGLPSRHEDYFNEDIEIGSLRKEEALASLFFSLALLVETAGFDADEEFTDLLIKLMYEQFDYARELEVREIQAIAGLRKKQLELLLLGHAFEEQEPIRGGDVLVSRDYIGELERIKDQLTELRDASRIPAWVKSESDSIISNIDTGYPGSIDSLEKLARWLAVGGKFSTIQFCMPDCRFLDMLYWWRTLTQFDGYDGGYRVAISDRAGLSRHELLSESVLSRPDKARFLSAVPEARLLTYLNDQEERGETISLCPSLNSFLESLTALEPSNSLNHPLIVAITGLWPVDGNDDLSSALDQTCSGASRFYDDGPFRIVPALENEPTIRSLLLEIKLAIQRWPGQVLVVDLTNRPGAISDHIDFKSDAKVGKLVDISIESDRFDRYGFVDLVYMPVDPTIQDQRDYVIESRAMLGLANLSVNVAFIEQLLETIDPSEIPALSDQVWQSLAAFTLDKSSELNIAQEQFQNLVLTRRGLNENRTDDILYSQRRNRPFYITFTSSSQEIFERIYHVVGEKQLLPLAEEPLFLAASGCLLDFSYHDCIRTSTVVGDPAEQQGLSGILREAAFADREHLRVEDAITGYEKALTIYDHLKKKEVVGAKGKIRELIETAAREELEKIVPLIEDRIISLKEPRNKVRFIEVVIDEYSSPLVHDLEYAVADLQKWWKLIREIPGLEVAGDTESLIYPEDAELLISHLADLFQGKSITPHEFGLPDDIYLVVISGRGVEVGGNRYIVMADYDPTNDHDQELRNGNLISLDQFAEVGKDRHVVFIYDAQFTESKYDSTRYDLHLDKHAHSLFAGRNVNIETYQETVKDNSKPTRLVSGGVPDNQVHIFWDGTLTQASDEIGELCRVSDLTIRSPLLANLLLKIKESPYDTVGTIGKNIDLSWQQARCDSKDGNFVFQGDLDRNLFDSSIQSNLAGKLLGSLYGELVARAISRVATDLSERFPSNVLNQISAAVLEIIPFEFSDVADYRSNAANRKALAEVIKRLAVLNSNGVDEQIDWYPNITLELMARAHMALGDFREARKTILKATPGTINNDILIRILSEATDAAVKQDAGELIREADKFLETLSQANFDQPSDSGRLEYIEKIRSEFSKRDDILDTRPYKLGNHPKSE